MITFGGGGSDCRYVLERRGRARGGAGEAADGLAAWRRQREQQRREAIARIERLARGEPGVPELQAAQQLRQQRVLSGDLRIARAHAGRAAALWEHCATHVDIKSVRAMVALARAAEPEQRTHGAVALRSVTLLSPTAAQLVVSSGGVAALVEMLDPHEEAALVAEALAALREVSRFTKRRAASCFTKWSRVAPRTPPRLRLPAKAGLCSQRTARGGCR